ncbi:GNAT family N-acetyltransferase [Butyrivibrio proteoclasticus]|uniref:GNAT family N-acetyltransferase n=1 Tax=Butyrivibrio proteoclasticus TaxID=43305 RepID=UPI0012DE676E|nr:GNAT family N-acetyltransferase [Butyrivibrio proteoclasticus]
MTIIHIEPFKMDYLDDYYREFNEEITKFQWPDPCESLEEEKELLGEFMDEVESGEMLLFSILSEDGEFLGSTEVHAIKTDCPEVGVWIKKSEWGKGYAFDALSQTLDYAIKNHGIRQFFYEADVRNAGSNKLLNKFAKDYEITDLEVEKLTTDSGKELELQGHILAVK